MSQEASTYALKIVQAKARTPEQLRGAVTVALRRGKLVQVIRAVNACAAEHPEHPVTFVVTVQACSAIGTRIA